MADTIAREAGIAIGFVFAPRLSDGREVLLHLSARGIEQWAHDPDAIAHEHGMNAGKTACAGSRQELHQHRFRLVVAGMGGGDGLEALLVGQLDQPLVAQLAGGVLEAAVVDLGMVANVGASSEERQVVGMG